MYLFLHVVHFIEVSRRCARTFYIFGIERWRFSVISKIILSNITPVSRPFGKSKPHAYIEWHTDRTYDVHTYLKEAWAVHAFTYRASIISSVAAAYR